MMADAADEPRDAEVLDGYGLDDLDPESLAAYRNLFRSFSANHVFLAGDDRELLRNLGGWRVIRATGKAGLTLAGLLMFGRMRSILDRLPHYQLDFRNLPPEGLPNQPRWLDRVTLDGTWSGNVFDFYRRVIHKLTADLKVPFRLDADLFRQDETEVHAALREAFINCLIHSDYEGRGGIRIFKHPDRFEFVNPGVLLLSSEQIKQGGKSDCRNPALQLMFRMLGLGEQAGTGYPSILRAWSAEHWRTPMLGDNVETNETHLRLGMISLLPEAVLEKLDRRFEGRFQRLSEHQRLAVATARIEGHVTNERLQELCSLHARDLTALLKGLVDQGFLSTKGGRRWAQYTVAISSSHHKGPTSHHRDPSSHHKDPNSHHNQADSVSGDRQRAENRHMAAAVASKRRTQPDQVDAAILALCSEAEHTLEQLVTILDRSPVTLRNHYLRRLTKEGRLALKYPQQPTHPQQAYRTAAPPVVELANTSSGD
jgi:ATP-dependent DNA helicase RecG